MINALARPARQDAASAELQVSFPAINQQPQPCPNSSFCKEYRWTPWRVMAVEDL
jgi:hypothetical protein